MKLSIIIPVFNEEKTILEILRRVTRAKISGITKEIIVVDDGSTDKTSSKLENSVYAKKIKFIKKIKNEGKGKAIRDGLANAMGEYLIIQDADLEYNPKDIQRLVDPIRKKQAE